MKRILAAILIFLGFGGAAFALGPTPTYQWDFNLTNSASGTNLVYSAIPGGDLQGAAAPTQEGILQMQNSSATPVNLLGLPGSGVGTNTFDRGALLVGSMGGSGPIIRTPALANTLTNLGGNNSGILTNFTVTAWIKADSAFANFPRILMFGQQNLDTGNGVNNVTFLQFNPGETLQLKVNGLGANGINGPNGLLSAGASDWLFVAVSYDSIIDPVVTNNVYFYAGDRFNPLPSGSGAAYGTPNAAGTSVNSVAPASPNGPGYINFSTNFNGDNATFSVASNNIWVYVGNRNGQGRSFNGRYDDIRIYANKVLSQSDLDLVRQDAHLPAPQRLTFTQPPQNTTVAEGQGASFSATTTPAPNITYQWYRFNPGSSVSNAIALATNQIYETPTVTIASDNGAKYGVWVHSTDPFADFNGAGIYTNAQLTVLPFAANVATPGMLKFEYFANTGIGTSVDTFLGAPTANYLNSTPDLTEYLPTLDSRTVFPDDSHNGYFVRISGWITPTITTNYVFFIHAADRAQFYLSTDGGVSSNLLCADTVDGLQVLNGPESITSFAGGTFSTPVALTAGTSYPVTVFQKAGTGPDVVQVAWRTDSGSQDLPANDANLADRLQPIPSAVLSTLALPGGTVSIGSSPANASVPAGSKATFTAGVTANYSTSNYLSGPTVIQWQKNGVNIPGATGASYTTPYLTPADTGSQFKAIVSIPGVSNQTTTASLAVTTDNVKPTVVSALADDSGFGVTVQFSEPVDAVTALNPANYSIPGVTVLGAGYAITTNLVDNPSYDAVKLTTGNALADNTSYTVSVSNVKDTAAVQNTIDNTGNMATFRSMGLLAGFVKFEYFENQTYTTLVGDVNVFVTLSPKFTNSDPDTVVFPTSAEMSPDGSPLTRSSGGGSLTQFPPNYGTRMSTIFTPPVTTNYVFYMEANETVILWLRRKENRATTRVIAWQSSATQKRQWTSVATANTAGFDTNLVGSSVTAPAAAPWPAADANNFATISLVAGQRYYLELDHFEKGGFDSFNSVTYVTASDNTTVVAPGNGSATALTGSVVGLHFPLPQITSFSKSGNNVSITWTNSFNQINLGALGFPGLGNITLSFPTTTLQSADVVSGPYTAATNTSPATIPATAPAQFFRIGEQ